jgi:cardiolipin synthase
MKLYLNWPNRLSILRILLIPVFVIFMVYRYQGSALITFCLATITDGLDGVIARSLNQKTVLGTFLDPLADKLLLTTCFVVLALLEQIPVWLPIVTISRDVIIVLGSAILYIINSHLEISPTYPGKLTTVSQLITVFWVLVHNQLQAPFGVLFSGLLWFTALITIISGMHYIYIGTIMINNKVPVEK